MTFTRIRIGALRQFARLVILAMIITTGTPAMASSARASSSASVISGFRLAHLKGQCQGSAPATFGFPFRRGDVPRGTHVVVRDGLEELPTQMDVKARNADGSVRHAVLTVNVPCSIDRSRSLALVTAPPMDNHVHAISLDDVLDSTFDSRIVLHEPGQSWHLDARDLLTRIRNKGGCSKAAIYCRHWLDGPLAGEWVVGAPPVDDSGHPSRRLMVFFAVRAYGPMPVSTVRVDTTVENDWAYMPDPHNVSYDVKLSVVGEPPTSFNDLTHYHQARWHHNAWWGSTQTAPWFVALNSRYLQDTPAAPSYQDVELSEKMLSQVRQSCAPMDHCDLSRYMPSTGAQAQIGPLPRWSSAYLVNAHDYRAYRWMLANSDALAAYSIHYRSRESRNALSVDHHPCATLVSAAEDAECPVAPHADDRLPHCKHDCQTPLKADAAHHGAPAYVAYMVTGDWFYNQELTFWADYLIFSQNQRYRGYRAGLIHAQQVRAQAWSLRTLGFAAYLLPDSSPFKKYFNQAIENNITWYNTHYADNPKANKLGFLEGHSGINYPSTGPHKRTGVSTWQLSFFNWAAGNLVDLGFNGAVRMRDYFSRFPLGLLNSPGFCPELASAYYLRVRDTQKSPFFTRYSQVYDETFPKLAGIDCVPESVARALRRNLKFKHYDYPAGSMVGYPKSGTGFVANFQIGLASAASSNHSNAAKAWHWFMTRPVRPNYRDNPQFAIVPTKPTRKRGSVESSVAPHK